MFHKKRTYVRISIDNRILEYYNLVVDKRTYVRKNNVKSEIVSWQYVCNSYMIKRNFKQNSN